MTDGAWGLKADDLLGLAGRAVPRAPGVLAELVWFRDGAQGTARPTWLGVIVRGGSFLTAADMGDEAPILLFCGLAYETALFELRVQVHWTPVGVGTQAGAFRQGRQRLQNLHQRLRRLQSASIHFNDGGAGARTGL